MLIFDSIASQARQANVIQLLALILAILTFVTYSRWEVAGHLFNNSWFTVTHVRLFSLTLIALAYGASCAGSEKIKKQTTAAVVLIFALVTLPFELVSYVATLPSTSLSTTIFIPFMTAIAFYGLGLAVGSMLLIRRSGSLMPLAITGVIVGMLVIDVRLKSNFLNPFRGTTSPSWEHSVIIGIMAAITLLFLLWPQNGQRNRGSQPSQNIFERASHAEPEINHDQ